MIQGSIFLSASLTFVLGAKHGLDLDHVATIDAITRSTLSRRVGLYFSVGHGLIVTLLSLLLLSNYIQSHIPIWLFRAGNIASITCLFIFGVISCLRTFVSKPLHPFSYHACLHKIRSPWLIMLIGGIFALSFDTITQISLLSLSASSDQTWLTAITLGALFTLGMISSDGLNGLLIAKLIQYTERYSVWFSKALGGVIALFSLVLGVVELTS